MKKKRKKFIKYTKERALLSDVLPYEVPIIFSNRYFYRFLVNNRIEVKGKELKCLNKYDGEDSHAFVEILKIVFDGIENIDHNKIEIDLRKRPYIYKIAHKEADFRELAIVHPLNQVGLVELYDKYKELIIYYSKVSSFSIRKADSVAKFVYFNDKLHENELGDQDDFLELKGKEYESLKSFFAYKKYTNIYRFYEDYRYQRAEKKYRILHKFDITKCFDSIYTHSISWALANKSIITYSLDNIHSGKKAFGGIFDSFMQNANGGETNGIVIGPEFSRVFAELILQQVDKAVEKKLRICEDLHNRRDYEIYRYVDDYFLFCDTDIQLEVIVKYFKHVLKEFKMGLNDAKTKSYLRPMITEISIAKQKINQLFEKHPIFKIEKREEKIPTGEIPNESTEEEIEESIVGQYVFKFYINSNKLASHFKAIVKESNVEYKDVLNYTLAILNSKIEKILTRFDARFKEFILLEYENRLSEEDLIRKKKLERNFTKYIIGYIDFIFFLYSVSPRVNSSIKLSNILSKIISFYRGAYKIKDTSVKVIRIRFVNKDLVFKKISDDIALILDRHKFDHHTQVEILYLLVVLRELGKNYRLNQFQLASYFNSFNKVTNRIEIKQDSNLNYFSIVVLLFYMKNIGLYEEYRSQLKEYIKQYILNVESEKRKSKAEICLLVLDLLVCPYLDDAFKKEILTMINVAGDKQDLVLSFKKVQKYWFVKWENFDLSKELNSKNSEEVYS